MLWLCCWCVVECVAADVIVDVGVDVGGWWLLAITSLQNMLHYLAVGFLIVIWMGDCHRELGRLDGNNDLSSAELSHQSLKKVIILFLVHYVIINNKI